MSAHKPPFNADRAEEYFTDLCVSFKKERNEVFKRDNEGRDSSNFVYSARGERLLGQELAMREVLEYFSKFDVTGWRPASTPPEQDGRYLAKYCYPHNSPPMIHFYGVLDYYATDPKPHWQHGGTGLTVEWWMPIPHTPDEETEE